MKFSYSAVWNDAMQMLRQHGSLVLAVAGVFFLLPGLLIGYLLPQPTGDGPDLMNAMMAYYSDNWLWLVLANIVNLIGYIAIYRLLFDQRGGTVAGAIGGALPILPMYFVMTVLTGMAVGAGFVLFILPGVYLFGRIAVSGAAMVAEGHRGPISPIARSWDLSRRRGWAVAGLLVIVILVGSLLTMVTTAVLGTVFILIGGREGLGPLLVLILNSALITVLMTVLITVLAAIYRALVGLSEPTTGA